jgi:hypothetical protein
MERLDEAVERLMRYGAAQPKSVRQHVNFVMESFCKALRDNALEVSHSCVFADNVVRAAELVPFAPKVK